MSSEAISTILKADIGKPELAKISRRPHRHFIEAFKAQVGGVNLAKVRDPVRRMHIDFALSTVERGVRVRDLIASRVRIAGKRYLDVGCGYGGFVVAFALSGAREAVGIDMSGGLLDYSRALLRDYDLDCPLYEVDLLSAEAVAKLGQFDIITCNDVIEHVADPGRGLAHLMSLLADGGLLYLQIPNRHCAAYVKRDGHYGMFGITTLSKTLADRYYVQRRARSGAGPDQQDVLYKSLAFYLNTLTRLGGSPSVLRSAPVEPEVAFQRIGLALEECVEISRRSELGVAAELRDEVQRRVRRLRAVFSRQHATWRRLRKERRLAEAAILEEKLLRGFHDDFWNVVVRKTGDGRKRATPDQTAGLKATVLTRRVAELTAALEAHATEVEQWRRLRKSLAWKLLRTLWWVRRRVLPPNSLRERVVLGGFRGLKAAGDELRAAVGRRRFRQ